MQFTRTQLRPIKSKEFIAQCMNMGLTRAQAKHELNKLKQDEIYVDESLTYQVNLDRNPHHGFPFPVWHLSIKRTDKEAFHDWRVFQEIKNAICGEQYEAFELYPAQDRVVDTANQYHLWIIADESIRLPVGWTEGRIDYVSGPFGAKQRGEGDE